MRAGRGLTLPESVGGSLSLDGLSEEAKEALNGNDKSQTKLGLVYGNGIGVPRNDAEAVKWFRKAADQGNAIAQGYLGLMYFKGDGVPKDLVQAHVWWNIAGANGNEEAKENLAIIEKQMTDTQREKAMDLARELFAKLPKTLVTLATLASVTIKTS